MLREVGRNVIEKHDAIASHQCPPLATGPMELICFECKKPENPLHPDTGNTHKAYSNYKHTCSVNCLTGVVSVIIIL